MKTIFAGSEIPTSGGEGRVHFSPPEEPQDETRCFWWFSGLPQFRRLPARSHVHANILQDNYKISSSMGASPLVAAGAVLAFSLFSVPAPK